MKKLSWLGLAVVGTALIALGCTPKSSTSSTSDGGVTGGPDASKTLAKTSPGMDGAVAKGGKDASTTNGGKDGSAAPDANASGSTKDGATGGGDAAAEDDGSVAALDAGHDAGHDSGPSCVNLTVKNIDVWCSISVNGGAPSSAATQSVCVAPGAIPLAVTPLGSFILGPWHGTDGDTGSGDSNANTTITISAGSAAKCVWICCPFSGGTGCPTTNQCP